MLVPPDYFLQARCTDGTNLETGEHLPKAWRVSAVEYNRAFDTLNGVQLKFSERIDAELAIVGLIELGVKGPKDLNPIDDVILLRAMTKYLRW